MSSHSESVSRALAFFEAWSGHDVLADLIRDNADFEFYLAGGVVRDAFLGAHPHPKDIDIFVGGEDAQACVEQLAKFGSLSTGSFGAYEWQTNDRDAVACDVILISRFYNGLWHCRDMIDALNQFDCTVNAIAINLRDRQLLNPQNGLRDIESRIMRAIRFDFPDEPIAEGSALTRNAVVWWRLLHYASILDLTIEPVTLNWLRQNRAFESSRADFEAEFHPVGDATSVLG